MSARRADARIDLLGFCLMSNHWHLIVRPRANNDLAKYMSWITNTHVKRHRAHRPGSSGHLYQGRFKSFPVQDDPHLLTVLRYVEANPLRAGMVERAQAWPWSSLGCMSQTRDALLCDWPIDRPRAWTTIVNRAMPQRDLASLRTSIARGRPFGAEPWIKRMIDAMGLAFTLRPRGRPRKQALQSPARRRRRKLEG